MALKCPEIGDSSKNSLGSSCSEEGILTQLTSCVPCASVTNSNEEEIPRKFAGLKLLSDSSSPKKAFAASDCSDVVDLPDNGRRSIIDLPPALVCEILHCLDAKELGIVSCVSTLLNSLASEHEGWKEFYYDRWGPPLPSKVSSSAGLPNNKSWKDLFIEREYMSKAFMGRYSIDVLHGHTDAVRSVFLLSPAKLIFTGGYDSVIRMWDMEDGLSIAASRPLGCTIRAIAADMELLVAAGTNGFLHCWKSIQGHPFVFELTGSNVNATSGFRLRGHEGPVTCLALDSTRIFSGSWDMSVRIWDRSLLKCLRVLRHGDWVWSLVPRGSTIASSAGGDVYIWDIGSGSQITVIYNTHSGNAHALARSYAGDLLFTGGEDGAIHMFEVLSMYDGHDVKPVATWIPHSGPVYSLAFEFPWLVSSSSDGRLALIDVRKLLKSRQPSSSRNRFVAKQPSSSTIEAPQRMLHGVGCNLFSVDVGADRVVCGGEEGVVRVWNFSQALEIEKRVQALRRVRLENRMRRRKVQIDMNNKAGRSDQCSVAAKRNQLKGDRNGIWHNKRGVGGKLKA